MKELIRLALEIRKTDNLLSEAQDIVASGTADPAFLFNLKNMEKFRERLDREFSEIASRNHIDVCNYHFSNPKVNNFLPLNEVASTLLNFQTAITTTSESIQQGRPIDIAKIHDDTRDFSCLRLAHFNSGDKAGNLSIALTANQEDTVLATLDEAVYSLLEVSTSTEPEQIHDFSQKYGTAPVKKLSDWCNSQIRTQASSIVDYSGRIQHKQIKRSLQQWDNLKETIMLVSDTRETEQEVKGTLVAINLKSRSFTLQLENGTYLNGKFAAGIVNSKHEASIPHLYKASLKTHTKINYATGTTTKRHTLLNLVSK